MTTTAPDVSPTSYADQRGALETFYARQMALLDDGRADEWAATFTQDATFSNPATTLVGRAELALAATAGVQERSRCGVVHRHIQTALVVSGADDAPVCSSYVLVVESAPTPSATIHASCVCVDELQLCDGEYLVSRRTVHVDGRG
ncbi:MAG: nuclear transport factor 2 family protein [Dermatophilaceae bacterium]